MDGMYWIRNRYGLHLAHRRFLREIFDEPIRATIKQDGLLWLWTCDRRHSQLLKGEAKSEQEAKKAVLEIAEWEYRPETGY